MPSVDYGRNVGRTALGAIVVALALILRAGPAVADYPAGLTAFERGDFQAALGQWRAAAEQGDARAQLGLGILLDAGRGTSENPREAFRWYAAAAEQGIVTAWYNLGRLLNEGRGIPRDVERAKRYWTMAADAGSAQAAHNLGVIAYGGVDGAQDFGLAARWFKRGADAGFPESQYMIGELYRLGVGVPADSAQATRYLALAELQGHPRAIERMRSLNASDAQRAAALQATTASGKPAAAATTGQAAPAFPPPAARAPTAPPLPGTPAAASLPPPQPTQVVGASSAPGAATVGGAVQLWIASFTVLERAQATWNGLVGAHRDLLGATRPVYRQVSINGAPVFRLLVVGFTSAPQADNVCNELRRRGAISSCTVEGG